MTNFNVKKMYSTVEKMADCEYSLEIITVPLQERIMKSTFFGNKNTIVERIAQIMDDCKISCQNKCSIL